MLKSGFEHAQADMERRGLAEQQVEAARLSSRPPAALVTDGDLLDEAERAALDASPWPPCATPPPAAGRAGHQAPARAFARASNEVCLPAHGQGIRSALAGHKIDELGSDAGRTPP